MRRGWMDWVPAEVPPEWLDERVSQVAAACRSHDIDALLLFADFVRPARVSALTHFIPFWSQAALVVTRDGGTLLTMATTGRTVQWIRSCARVDEVVVGPDLGATLGQWLQGRFGAARVALAGLSDWPQPVIASLQRALPESPLQDAQAWYPLTEVGFRPAPGVAARALALVRDGLEQVTAQPYAGAHDIVAAIEGRCRSQGAEEVSVLLAPDLRHSAIGRRLEGSVALGERFAVQLSLAYKGHWLRGGSSFMRHGGCAVELPACREARTRLQGSAVPGLPAARLAQGLITRDAGSTLLDWSLEARRGGLPLACIAAAGYEEQAGIPPFSTFSARLGADGHAWLLVEPLLAT